MISESKKRIILAACQLSANKSLRDVGISELAKKTGISLSTICRLFVNKEHLLVSTFQHFWDLIADNLRGLEKNVWNQTSLEQLEMILLLFQLFAFKNSDLIRFAMNTPLPDYPMLKEPEAKQIWFDIDAKRRICLEIIETIISKGQEAGMLTSKMKTEVIRDVLIGSSWKIMEGFLKGDEKYTLKEANEGIKFLLNSLTQKAIV